ncbi:hypothetical protein ACFL4T_00010 [candidate division KSB1 bacterium]
MLKCLFFKRKIVQLVNNELNMRPGDITLNHIENCTKCRELFNSYSLLTKDIRMVFDEKTRNIVPITNKPLPELKKSREEKLTFPDRLIEFMYPNGQGSAAAVSTFSKLIPAIILTLFILLFFATPVTGNIPFC